MDTWTAVLDSLIVIFATRLAILVCDYLDTIRMGDVMRGLSAAIA